MQDVIIVGGSFAGLSAALMLARARRHITIIDDGQPRNRFASHAHGLLALDGVPGSQILATARTQLQAYPTVTFIDGRAVAAAGRLDDFAVETATGERLAARRLLLATGFSDRLPDVPGLAEGWGRTVLHCPYCHGYEIGGGPIGVLASHPMSAHQAALVADWGDVTYFTHGGPAPDDATTALLQRRNVAIEAATVTAVVHAGDGLDGVRLADGRLVAVKALFVAPELRMQSDIADRLGCAFETSPVAAIVQTDAFKQTSVPGVYAAGDMSLGAANIPLSNADGARAGHGIHRSLVFPEA